MVLWCAIIRKKNLVIILWSGLVYHGQVKRHVNSCVVQFIGTVFPEHSFGTRAAFLCTHIDILMLVIM